MSRRNFVVGQFLLHGQTENFSTLSFKNHFEYNLESITLFYHFKNIRDSQASKNCQTHLICTLNSEEGQKLSPSNSFTELINVTLTVPKSVSHVSFLFLRPGNTFPKLSVG